MTSMYINSLELVEPEVIFTDRRVTNSWSVANLERTGQQPTDYSIGFNIYGDDRHAIANSIAAEIERCERILIDGSGASRKLYGTRQSVWLNTVALNITEGGGKRLVGDITGLVDLDIIHSCDFLTDWACDAGDSIALNSTVREGKYSILSTVSNPSASPSRIIYTPVDILNLSAKKYIRFWFYTTEDQRDTTLALELHTSVALGYFSWDDLDYTTSIWNCIECAIEDTSIHSGPSGDPTLESISMVKFATLKTPTASRTYKIDGIYAY